ncbi:hypothetical protein D3C80_1404160 [compost metagenome]
MRQVTTHAQVQAQDRIARLQYRYLYRHVGLCTTVRLHIGIFNIKDRFQAIDC